MKRSASLSVRTFLLWALLVCSLFAVDLFLPQRYAVSVAYVAVVALSLLARNQHTTLYVAGLSAAFTVVGLLLPPPGGEDLSVAVFNRASALMALGIATAVIVAWNRLEKKRAELSAKVVSAQEEYSSRLARELHDDIVQRIAALSMDLARAGAKGAGEQLERTETLRGFGARLEQIGDSLREFSHKIHPATLQLFGLANALTTECERAAEANDLEIHCEVADPSQRLSADAALCLYRVTQEALRNVVKHAHATKASVVLREKKDSIELEVWDNGSGFEAQTVKAGLGLLSMKERIRLAEGSFSIRSRIGQGTIIRASVPAESCDAI